MLDLLPDIQSWFEEKREHLRVFAESDCRVENWFKGELLVLFRRLQEGGRITRIQREVKLVPRGGGQPGKVDLVITIAYELHLCELKAPCISESVTNRDLQFYVRNNKIGFVKDFRKLDALEGDHKWILAFIYPRPMQAEWDRAVSTLTMKCPGWKPVTSLSDAGPELFVSLWHSQSTTCKSEAHERAGQHRPEAIGADLRAAPRLMPNS